MTAASSSSSSDSSASMRLEMATAPGLPARRRGRPPTAGTSSSPSPTLATKSTGLPVSGPRSRSAFGCVDRRRDRAHGPAGAAAPRATSRSHASSAIARAVSRAGLAHDLADAGARPGSRSAKISSVSIVSMSASGSTRPSGWMTCRRCGSGPRAGSRRSRGCWRGTGCRAPRPCARPPPGRRCRARGSCRRRGSRHRSARASSLEALVAHAATTATFGSIVVKG